jgi:hypothetical protein
MLNRNVMALTCPVKASHVKPKSVSLLLDDRINGA